MEYTASQIAEILNGSIVGDKDARVSTLAKIEEAFRTGDKVNIETLLEKGLISKNNAKVKILGDGELTLKITVSDVLVSKSAKEAIEKAGGSVAEDQKEA